MKDYKAGDYLLCITSEHSFLTRGKKYRIHKRNGYLLILCDDGDRLDQSVFGVKDVFKHIKNRGVFL